MIRLFLPTIFSVLTLLGPVAAQDANDLNNQVSRAYQAQQWSVALEALQALVELQPRNPVHAYNMACVLALSGKSASALEWLLRSAEQGFSDVELLERDEDLATLRDSAAFRVAAKRVRTNLENMSADYLAAARRTEIKVVLPANYESLEKAPVIIALHPFGGTHDWITDRWREAAEKAGAILIAPNAVFPQGQGRQWGTPRQANVILERALAVAGSLKINRDQMVLTGFSQGGFMTFALGLRHRFTGLVPVGGNYIPAAVDSDRSRLPRIYMMVGGEDRVVESNRVAAEQLGKQGATVKLEVFEGVGHSFPPNTTEELVKALRFVFSS